MVISRQRLFQFRDIGLRGLGNKLCRRVLSLGCRASVWEFRVLGVEFGIASSEFGDLGCWALCRAQVRVEALFYTALNPKPWPVGP